MAGLRIARTKARPAEYVDALAELTEKLKNAKEYLAEAEEAHLQAQTEVLTLMASAGIKTSTVRLPDARYKVTSVQNERLDIDEIGLRKALSAPVFDKLCQLKLDRTKLELAIAEGRVDPVVVASHTKNVKHRPFVKLTVLPGSES